MIKGSLTIKLIQAELTRDVKKFGKMNVFVTFEHKTSTHKSEICESEGKEPSWENQQFEFLIKDDDEHISLTVFSKNLLKNKQVGQSKLWVENLIKYGGEVWWEQITHEGKPAGKV